MPQRVFTIDAFLGLIDRLAPRTPTESREDRRRARSVAAAALLGCAILSATAVSTLMMGLDHRLAMLNLAGSLVILGLLMVARRFRSLELLANALVTIGFVHTLVLSGLSGGRNIGALFGFSVFPLVAVLLAGWRSGLVFTGLSAAAVLLTPWVPLDLLAPTHLPRDPVGPALIRDALNVILAVGLLSALYDAVRSSTLRDAERSGAHSRHVAERQRALVELSHQLQEAPPETFDRELEHAVKRTARLAGADRTVLRLFDLGGYDGRFSWGEADFIPVVGRVDREEDDHAFPWTASQMREGRIVQVKHLRDLPAEAVRERELLEARGVVSWLCVPIQAGRTAAGYQIFETMTEARAWDEEETAALRLMTQLLASNVLRHRTAEALRESEKKFAIAFRDHPDAMFIMDLGNDEILECNEQWIREAGRTSRDEVIGRQPWEFGFEVSAQHRDALHTVLLEVGRSPAVEIPVLARAGDERTFLVSGTRIQLGGRTCALMNVHDLTERKRLEQQLIHAQKMEAVGRLAGGIAHDYNNMLTVIMGYSAALIEELDGDLRDDAVEIQEAARRSAELTRQLLAFSRRQMLQTAVLEPDELIAGLETMLRPLIGKSVELSLTLASTGDRVRSDRGQLEQAIVNLVVNGRDAMPDGGELRVETRTVDLSGDAPRPPDLAPGRYVRISVEDEGEGMDRELVEHAMEPFYTTKPEGEGTGLGLPMAHGLARQCDGALVLDSGRGRGTRARIFLPLVDEELESADPTGGLPAPPVETHARRILVVEDEAPVRRLAVSVLRGAGYDVAEVEDGEQALDRILEAGEDIDLVLTDVVMPKLSGISLLGHLRDARPELPVVLMSGYPDVAEGKPIPDDVVFLLKPFDPARLCQAVARAFVSSGKEPPTSD